MFSLFLVIISIIIILLHTSFSSRVEALNVDVLSVSETSTTSYFHDGVKQAFQDFYDTAKSPFMQQLVAKSPSSTSNNTIRITTQRQDFFSSQLTSGFSGTASGNSQKFVLYFVTENSTASSTQQIPNFYNRQYNTRVADYQNFGMYQCESKLISSSDVLLLTQAGFANSPSQTETVVIPVYFFPTYRTSPLLPLDLSTISIPLFDAGYAIGASLGLNASTMSYNFYRFFYACDGNSDNNLKDGLLSGILSLSPSASSLGTSQICDFASGFNSTNFPSVCNNNNNNNNNKNFSITSNAINSELDISRVVEMWSAAVNSTSGNSMNNNNFINTFIISSSSPSFIKSLYSNLTTSSFSAFTSNKNNFIVVDSTTDNIIANDTTIASTVLNSVSAANFDSMIVSLNYTELIRRGVLNHLKKISRSGSAETLSPSSTFSLLSSFVQQTTENTTFSPTSSILQTVVTNSFSASSNLVSILKTVSSDDKFPTSGMKNDFFYNWTVEGAILMQASGDSVILPASTTVRSPSAASATTVLENVVFPSAFLKVNSTSTLATANSSLVLKHLGRFSVPSSTTIQNETFMLSLLVYLSSDESQNGVAFVSQQISVSDSTAATLFQEAIFISNQEEINAFQNLTSLSKSQFLQRITSSSNYNNNNTSDNIVASQSAFAAKMLDEFFSCFSVSAASGKIRCVGNFGNLTSSSSSSTQYVQQKVLDLELFSTLWKLGTTTFSSDTSQDIAAGNIRSFQDLLYVDQNYGGEDDVAGLYSIGGFYYDSASSSSIISSKYLDWSYIVKITSSSSSTANNEIMFSRNGFELFRNVEFSSARAEYDRKSKQALASIHWFSAESERLYLTPYEKSVTKTLLNKVGDKNWIISVFQDGVRMFALKTKKMVFVPSPCSSSSASSFTSPTCTFMATSVFSSSSSSSSLNSEVVKPLLQISRLKLYIFSFDRSSTNFVASTTNSTAYYYRAWVLDLADLRWAERFVHVPATAVRAVSFTSATATVATSDADSPNAKALFQHFDVATRSYYLSSSAIQFLTSICGGPSILPNSKSFPLSYPPYATAMSVLKNGVVALDGATCFACPALSFAEGDNRCVPCQRSVISSLHVDDPQQFTLFDYFFSYRFAVSSSSNINNVNNAYNLQDGNTYNFRAMCEPNYDLWGWAIIFVLFIFLVVMIPFFRWMVRKERKWKLLDTEERYIRIAEITITHLNFLKGFSILKTAIIEEENPLARELLKHVSDVIQLVRARMEFLDLGTQMILQIVGQVKHYTGNRTTDSLTNNNNNNNRRFSPSLLSKNDDNVKKNKNDLLQQDKNKNNNNNNNPNSSLTNQKVSSSPSAASSNSQISHSSSSSSSSDSSTHSSSSSSTDDDDDDQIQEYDDDGNMVSSPTRKRRHRRHHRHHERKNGENGSSNGFSYSSSSSSTSSSSSSSEDFEDDGNSSPNNRNSTNARGGIVGDDDSDEDEVVFGISKLPKNYRENNIFGAGDNLRRIISHEDADKEELIDWSAGDPDDDEDGNNNNNNNNNNNKGEGNNKERKSKSFTGVDMTSPLLYEKDSAVDTLSRVWTQSRCVTAVFRIQYGDDYHFVNNNSTASADDDDLVSQQHQLSPIQLLEQQQMLAALVNPASVPLVYSNIRSNTIASAAVANLKEGASSIASGDEEESSSNRNPTNNAFYTNSATISGGLNSTINKAIGSFMHQNNVRWKPGVTSLGGVGTFSGGGGATNTMASSAGPTFATAGLRYASYQQQQDAAIANIVTSKRGAKLSAIHDEIIQIIQDHGGFVESETEDLIVAHWLPLSSILSSAVTGGGGGDKKNRGTNDGDHHGNNNNNNAKGNDNNNNGVGLKRRFNRTKTTVGVDEDLLRLEQEEDEDEVMMMEEQRARQEAENESKLHKQRQQKQQGQNSNDNNNNNHNNNSNKYYKHRRSVDERRQKQRRDIDRQKKGADGKTKRYIDQMSNLRAAIVKDKTVHQQTANATLTAATTLLNHTGAGLILTRHTLSNQQQHNHLSAGNNNMTGRSKKSNASVLASVNNRDDMLRGSTLHDGTVHGSLNARGFGGGELGSGGVDTFIVGNRSRKKIPGRRTSLRSGDRDADYFNLNYQAQSLLGSTVNPQIWGSTNHGLNNNNNNNNNIIVNRRGSVAQHVNNNNNNNNNNNMYERRQSVSNNRNEYFTNSFDKSSNLVVRRHSLQTGGGNILINNKNNSMMSITANQKEPHREQFVDVFDYIIGGTNHNNSHKLPPLSQSGADVHLPHQLVPTNQSDDDDFANNNNNKMVEKDFLSPHMMSHESEIDLISAGYSASKRKSTIGSAESATSRAIVLGRSQVRNRQRNRSYNSSNVHVDMNANNNNNHNTTGNNNINNNTINTINSTINNSKQTAIMRATQAPPTNFFQLQQQQLLYLANTALAAVRSTKNTIHSSYNGDDLDNGVDDDTNTIQISTPQQQQPMTTSALPSATIKSSYCLLLPDLSRAFHCVHKVLSSTSLKARGIVVSAGISHSSDALVGVTSTASLAVQRFFVSASSTREASHLSKLAEKLYLGCALPWVYDQWLGDRFVFRFLGTADCGGTGGFVSPTTTQPTTDESNAENNNSIDKKNQTENSGKIQGENSGVDNADSSQTNNNNNNNVQDSQQQHSQPQGLMMWVAELLGPQNDRMWTTQQKDAKRMISDLNSALTVLSKTGNAEPCQKLLKQPRLPTWIGEELRNVLRTECVPSYNVPSVW